MILVNVNVKMKEKVENTTFTLTLTFIIKSSFFLIIVTEIVELRYRVNVGNVLYWYMKTKTLFLLLFSLSLLFGGCISISSMQTAKTTEKGQFSGSFGIGTDLYTLNENEDTKGNFALAPEVAVRLGISDKVDVGAKIFMLGAAFDAKYNFHQSEDEKWAFAAGLMFDDQIEQFDFRGIYVPIYASIHPTEKFAAYLNPRIGFRYWNTYKKIAFGYGGGLGAKYGKKVSFFVETSIYNDSNIEDFDFFLQFNGGVMYNLK